MSFLPKKTLENWIITGVRNLCNTSSKQVKAFRRADNRLVFGSSYSNRPMLVFRSCRVNRAAHREIIIDSLEVVAVVELVSIHFVITAIIIGRRQCQINHCSTSVDVVRSRLSFCFSCLLTADENHLRTAWEKQAKTATERQRTTARARERQRNQIWLSAVFPLRSCLLISISRNEPFRDLTVGCLLRLLKLMLMFFFSSSSSSCCCCC